MIFRVYGHANISILTVALSLVIVVLPAPDPRMYKAYLGSSEAQGFLPAASCLTHSTLCRAILQTCM